MQDGDGVTRLHIGNGAVFLDGWTNIDLQGPHTFLASNRPDLVKKWKTTEDKYYARQEGVSIGSLRDGPLHQETVCDVYGSLDNIPAAYWSVSAVLIRHVFEHLSLTEAHKALDQIDGIMEPNGTLTIDVPDHEETLRLYRETGDKFYVRHLLGPRNSEHGYHLVGYTRERLRSLVEDHGFIFECEEDFKHLYPSISLRFVKPGPRAPRDYVPITVEPGAIVADLGPGLLSHPRANVYIDNDPVNVERLRKKGKTVILGDVETGLAEIPDKSYDVIWASHCFEHFHEPEKAAATLTRIGKSGVLVMPSAWKESLTNFEERSHLWSVLDNPTPGGPPIFIRATAGRLDQMRNTDVMKSLSRVFRTGPNDRIIPEGRLLRKWWYESEKHLDVVYHWTDKCEVIVIQ